MNPAWPSGPVVDYQAAAAAIVWGQWKAINSCHWCVHSEDFNLSCTCAGGKSSKLKKMQEAIIEH